MKSCAIFFVNSPNSVENRGTDVLVLSAIGEKRVGFDTNNLLVEYKNADLSIDKTACEKIRFLYELSIFRDMLQLTDGDDSIIQMGGIHKDIRGKVQGYQSHHIPARSTQAPTANTLPAILLTKEDHRLTDSYAGKSGRKIKSFLPDVKPSNSYKDEVISSIEQNDYISVVRAEIFNIKDQFGTKYDGAIKHYIHTLAEYVGKHGIPYAKK